MRLPDIAPTLTDTQVLEFCRRGYLILEGVVAQETNERVSEFICAHPYGLDDSGGFEDDKLLAEDWFVAEVILNPQAAGAVRSLLGASGCLADLDVQPSVPRAPNRAQQWHRDGLLPLRPRSQPPAGLLLSAGHPSRTRPHRSAARLAFSFNLGRLWATMAGSGGLSRPRAPAGTIFITAYPIWHRRGASTAEGVRNMLKYLYWRMVPPQRDWIVEPDFSLDDLNDLESALYGGKVHPAKDQFHHWHDVARMFYWLAGKKDDFHTFLGTDNWPMGHPPRRQPGDFHTFPS